MTCLAFDANSNQCVSCAVMGRAQSLAKRGWVDKLVHRARRPCHMRQGASTAFSEIFTCLQMAAEAPSKAFRARIDLDDHEVLRVQQYAATSCALHAIFRSERGTTILIGLRDTARSSASFARSLGGALQRMGVPVAQALRSKWCSLSPREKRSLCVWLLHL